MRQVPRLSGETNAAPDQAYAGGVITCDFCGKQEADEAKTLTWTTSVENGRLRRYCDECSRTHLRAMEGKLDSEFW
jgi:hypothetical protein